MEIFRTILVLYKKDLLLEARTKITIASILLFAFLILLIFNFGFTPGASGIGQYAPGILWVTFSFAGVLALSRLFDYEKERGVIRGIVMAPIDKISVYFSKLLHHYTLMILMEAVTVGIFIFLFNPDFSLSIVAKILLVSFAATLGFSAIGVVVSSMLFSERLKELLLPLVFYPLVIPLVIVAVKSTAGIIETGVVSNFRFIAGFDIIFIVASAMLYEFVLESN